MTSRLSPTLAMLAFVLALSPALAGSVQIEGAAKVVDGDWQHTHRTRLA